MGKRNNRQAVVEYYTKHPKASLGEVARALGVGKSTVTKYRPEEFKPKEPTEEELRERAERWKRASQALRKLDWEQIKEIRNANDYRLYPLKWDVVEMYFEYHNRPIPAGIKSAEEFEGLLKEVCDSLYDWHLYEPCPVCGKGIRVPRWVAGRGQWTPFCGCSEFPLCDFSLNRDGESLYSD